ncbi:peptide deformylase [Glycomyces buryatensis]|uniref:Peptide deformylase n=1 Tax=Glycomyces buryatensis TaxID=2570927 RepID=A0A4S8PYE9_9ACTN|nr:peptide deformylase [Glycomyces buryatensis]THV35691.1 formylmethionine deformylase [Glycomyces buryatensis]
MSALEPEDFAATVRHWLEVSGFSRKKLAKEANFSSGYVSKVASGAERGSLDFAARADTAMATGGALERAWQAHHGQGAKPSAEPIVSAPGGLIVDQDIAELHYGHGQYRLTQRRRIVNTGSEPITRYLIRIAVDKFPGEPERSNAHYREHPLRWEDLNLEAWCGSGRTEPITWTVQHDRDSFKEVWLSFRGAQGRRLPIYPGEAGWIEYTYTVPEGQWGNWFRRAVRLPTNHLGVRLDMPADRAPEVWGTHTSLAGDDLPLPSPIEVERIGDRLTYSWSCENPPLHARYTMQWRWSAGAYDEPMQTPSQVMADLGIVQDPDAVLRRTARRFNLPAEAEQVRDVVARLEAAAEQITKVHDFTGKGRGLAAPQIGVDAAAAVVYTPGAVAPLVLLNPVVVETSAETDMQYEGCLSFFDTRSRIPRPLVAHIEHTGLDGTRRITVFDQGIARLVLHEVDHLHGVLCKDRLPEGEEPTPIEEYRGTGSAWQYK